MHVVMDIDTFDVDAILFMKERFSVVLRYAYLKRA